MIAVVPIFDVSFKYCRRNPNGFRHGTKASIYYRLSDWLKKQVTQL